MSMSLNAGKPPARLGRPIQIVFSRGDDPEHPDGALWRIGARVVLEDEDGALCDVPLTLTVADPDAPEGRRGVTYRPNRGDEINLLELMTPAQQAQIVNLVSGWEQKIAAALGLAGSAGRIARHDWQRPGR